MTERQVPALGEFLLYQTKEGRTRVECRFVEEALWLTRALMAEIFQVTVPTIKEHLKTLYADGEIQPEATIRKFLIVRREGGSSGQSEHRPLQLRRNPSGELPCALNAWHAVPPIGHRTPEKSARG